MNLLQLLKAGTLKKVVGCFSIIIILFPLYPCLSQDKKKSPFELDESRKHLFELKTAREIALLSIGAGMNLYNAHLQSNVEPLTPDQIVALDPEQVNPFDRKTINRYRDIGTGDLMLYASFVIPFAVPLTLYRGEEHKSDWKVWAVMMSELLLINSGLNGILKSSVQRTRPFVYNPDVDLELKTEKKARYSFYSAHTATTAALTFFTARLFSSHLTDTKTKSLIWTGAALYPAIVGLARQNTGRHFRTDIITGYIFGGFLGYVMPDLHRISRDKFTFIPSFGQDSFQVFLTYSL